MIRVRHWQGGGAPDSHPQDIVRIVDGILAVSDHDAVYAELAALPASQTGSWCFVHEGAVPATHPPLRATVNEQPTNLRPAVG